MDKETDKKKNNEKLSFLMNSLRKRLYSENDKLCSNKVGEKGIELIFNNNFMGALQYFKQALSINSNDTRHYLNISYCYLKMRKYALALTNVLHVLKESDVPAYLFIANLRAGQAASGLKEYKKAESFFKAAISIDLNNPYPKRELMCLKINSLVNAGYSKRDALSTIEMSSMIDDIQSCSSNLKVQGDLQILNNPNDDLIYSSDDDESSNFKILNRILNYEPGKIKLDHIANKLSTVSKKSIVANMNKNFENKNSTTKTQSTETTKHNPLNLSSSSLQANNLIPEEIPTLYFSDSKSSEVPDSNSKRSIVNHFAIWVGNVGYEITESMLRELFSQYGSISRFHRPVGAKYAFIHYSDDESVKNALQYSYCQLYGWNLIVRPSVITLP